MEANDCSYRFQGIEGEEVPRNVQNLTFTPGIQVLLDDLCSFCKFLQEVTLPQGLISIGNEAFSFCRNLLDVKICTSVESIGEDAFFSCRQLKNVEFQCSMSSPPRLETIGESAFQRCKSLQRIKIPSSVSMIGDFAFDDCETLVAADLSKASITQISSWTFSECMSLRTVSLPSSLERICREAFNDCVSLVTVIIPLDSRPIHMEQNSINACNALANLVLPQGSKAERDAFTKCELLQGRYGEGSDSIVAGLACRFDNFPVHKICYHPSSTTAQELCDCIQRTNDDILSLVDEFGMTPFHVLFSTPEPSQDLLKVLLDKYSYHVLVDCQDANDNRPMDYLISNWNEATAPMVKETMQRWMIDPFLRWGATSWAEAMQSRVQALLAGDDDDDREISNYHAICDFTLFRDMEVTSILEMVLWKKQLKGGRNNDGTKRQALDREECRCVCGSDVVIPSVVEFLDFILPS
ncbi:unnamed protein product [Cylindrotheca closterium]|uniref:Uncharacterized protein n=1 Tax=Cylindrotheca closterium TaxID=2856 RepID=A0AAD2JGW5_9STRA|nr:unnamed protein product [Cylindrotheca closterium]